MPGVADPSSLESVMPAPAGARGRRRLWFTAAALVILAVVAGGLYLLLAGPPSDGGRYDSPQDLIAAMEANGVVCAGYTETRGAVGAVARGSCRIGSDETIVSIYASETDPQRHADQMAALFQGTADTDMVIGVNWTVNCHNAAQARAIADAIGGRVFHSGK